MMTVIKEAQKFFSSEERKGEKFSVMRGNHLLKIDVGVILKALSNKENPKRLNLNLIINSLWTIFILVHRIETISKSVYQKKIPDSFGDPYIKADIKFIHYEIRSIFDYLGKLIEDVYGYKLENKNKGEFSVLKSKIDKGKIVDVELVKLMQKYGGFFELIRDIRGHFIHEGKEYYVLSHTENLRIAFWNNYAQLHKFGFINSTFDEDAKRNNDNTVLCVKPYIAQIVAILVILLDDFGKMISVKYGLDTHVEGSSLSSPGIPEFLKWTQEITGE